MVKFTLLSGACWLFDLSLLLGLTQLAGLGVSAANMLSSLAAAAVVYLVAHRRVHEGRSGGKGARLACYLVYTVCVIMAASWLIGLCNHWLEAAYPLAARGALPVLISKILITPPQLLCNFFVSRFVARLSLTALRG